MTRPSFGRRATPLRIRRAKENSKFPVLEGKKVLLTSTEGFGEIWKYDIDGGSTDGALRLISVKKLLNQTSSATIELVEWTPPKTWPRTEPQRTSLVLPQSWPRYAAISHVWQPSEDAARFRDKANRPLDIDIGENEHHTISWLGLVQAATAAKAKHRCDYLWLDLLCLNQRSHNDKKLQIRQMAEIYRNATMVIVMPGGVVAGQDYNQPSAWITRAWTFQEATLGLRAYVLVNWAHPGSFSYFSRLDVKGASSAIALAPLKEVALHLPGKGLGVSVMRGEDGAATREVELALPLLCLGNDLAAVSALAAILDDSYAPSDDDNNSDGLGEAAWLDSADGSSSSDFDGGDANAESVARFPNNSSYHQQEYGAEASAQVFHTFDSSSDGDANFNWSDSDSGSDLGGFGNMPQRNASGGDDHTSKSQLTAETGNGDDPPILQYPSNIRYGAVWRSMWLRTSTKPQDLVFSMMHLLDVNIKVDYSQSLDKLIFDLVEATRLAPAWLTIGYDLPVRPESGLIPTLPTFESNKNPKYTINGDDLPASELVCNGEFFCELFDIDIKHTSMTEGHLICGTILEAEIIPDGLPKPSEVDPSFIEIQLRLSCPSGFQVKTRCRFKGQMGSLVVVIGGYSTRGAFDEFELSSIPFVYLLSQTQVGTWQKTGAGTLDVPLVSVSSIPGLERRHLQVGGFIRGLEAVPCDCPNAAKHEVPGPNNISSEDLKDLDNALCRAALSGEEHRAQQLIDLAANVNVQGIYGSPILAACCSRKTSMVELLLNHGAKVNVPSPIDSVDLHYDGDWYGTPLQAACILGNEEMVRLLVDRGGADVNAQEGPEGTALQAAVRDKYRKKIVKLLLGYGADPNIAGGRYGTALMAAQAHDPPSTELLHLLIDHGANVNSTTGVFLTEDGWVCRTALQMACRHGAVGQVRALLSRGADINLCSGGSFGTALQEAAYYGFSLICEILLDHGADVNARGGYFGSALQAATAGSFSGNRPSTGLHEYIVRLLLQKGADVNAEGGYYGCALNAARPPNGRWDIAQLLLEGGARDPPVREFDHTPAEHDYAWMPLQSAANYGRVEVVEVLLEQGADVALVDNHGRTALHLASGSGHVEIVELLRKR